MKTKRWWLPVLISVSSLFVLIGLLRWQTSSAASLSSAADSLAAVPVASAHDGALVSETIRTSVNAPVRTQRVDSSVEAAPPIAPVIDLPPQSDQSALNSAPPLAPIVQANDTLLNLPLRFIANTGQTDESVRFTVQGAGHTLFFTPDEIVFARPDIGAGQADVRVRFEGANPSPVIDGLSPLPGGVNYFQGSDPAHWQVNVPTYEAITYRDLYPGISLIYRGNEGRLKSEFIVAPGAQPSAIRLAYSGAQSIRLREDGAVVIQTALGELIDEPPIIYQEIDGVRREVSGAYVIVQQPIGAANPSGVVGFEVGPYDPTQPLVIDPVLSYSSFLGGNAGADRGYAVAVDAAGNIYVAGETIASDFPVKQPVQSTLHGSLYLDAFVTKIVRAGSVYTYGFSTYLGGSLDDSARSLAVDNSGAIYLTGQTQSSNWPTTTNAIQPTFRGNTDAFVTKIISASGAYTLSYSSYLGGSLQDYGYSIAVDSADKIYLTGLTQSTNWPTTTNAIQPKSNVGNAFVTTIVSTSGVYTYAYSSYIGGSGSSTGRGIAVDSAGSIYLAGDAGANWPLKNAFRSTVEVGGRDVVLTKIITSGGVYTYALSTYIGGSSADYGYGFALSGTDDIYLTGQTYSIDYPTTANALQAARAGASDAFVTRIISASGVYTYGFSTYLGGSGGANEAARAIAVDANGIYVTGQTDSIDWPVSIAIQPRYAGAIDTFVTKIATIGGTYAYSYSTFLGGSGSDVANALATNGAGEAIIVGTTSSSNWPTSTNALDTTGSGIDAFVAVVSEQSPQVSLLISKTVVPLMAMPGELITFTIAYSNVGNVAAANVLITDQIPISLTGVSYSASDPSLSSIGLTPYTWKITSLPVGDGGLLTVTGFVSTSMNVAGTIITNTATITSSTAEDLAFNNASTVNFKVTSCWATFNDGASVYGVLQNAVDDAPASSTIKLAGVCNDLTTRLANTQLAYITKSLTLRGGYSSTNWLTSDPINTPTTLDARRLGRALYINGAGSVLIENLKVISGTSAAGGGAILVSGSDLVLSNTTLLDNVSTANGGGIYASSATSLTLLNTTLQNNVSSILGGGLYSSNNITLTNVQLLTNTAAGGGGAYVAGYAAVSDGRIEGNRGGYGGGLYVGADLTGTNMLVINNQATSTQGGGTYVYGRTTLSGGLWSGNRATQWGGGLSTFTATATLDNVEFYSNSITSKSGGGMYLAGLATVSNSRFENNKAPVGGGLSAFTATVSLSNTSFISNTATDVTSGGGGLYANATANIINSYFERNRGQYGGGFESWSALNVTNTTFVSNTAGASGGGGYANLAVNIIGGAFISNTAGYGGGLYLYDSHAAVQNDRLINLLFARNTSVYSQGHAIGIALNADTVDILYATIVGNASSAGSAIEVYSGTVNVTNTIIAQYPLGVNSRAGAVTHEDYNLFYGAITQTIGVTSGGHSLIGNPLFANPASDDYHLTGGSPAIDAGINAGVTIDYFGQARPEGLGYDIGYAEFVMQADDLWVSKSVTPTIGGAGQRITYTVSYGNAGSNTASSVILTDVVPLNYVRNVTYTASGATLILQSNSRYIWQVQDLTSGQGGLITITADITPGLGSGITFTNVVSITGAATENITANNSATASVTTIVYDTITALASSINPASAGQAITLTATVTSAYGAPTGNVTFYDKGVPIGVSALTGSSAELVTSTLAAGTHPISATYGGDANFASSASSVLSQVVTAIPTYTLSVFTTGTGGGLVIKFPNQISYTVGTVVALTATANGGSVFAGWSGDVSGSTNPVTVTMNANRSVTATFDLIPIVYYTLTVNMTGTGSGSVIKSPDQISYTVGTVVAMTATANGGSVFAGWSGDVSGSTNPVTVTMNANRSVTATFDLIPIVYYTLTVNMTGTGSGSVIKFPDQISYTVGTVVAMTATANGGSVFAGWSGDASGSTNPVTVTMNANRSVTATFDLIPIVYYTLTVNMTGTGSGSVIKSPNQISYTVGTVVALTATANSGSVFAGWSGDAIGLINPVTVTMNANRSVTATFDLSSSCTPIGGLGFNFSPIAPRVGEAVAFTSTISAGELPITYTWAWGDGALNTLGTTALHTFPITSTTRTYTVTLNAMNTCDAATPVQQPVTVQARQVYLPLVLK